MVTITTATMEVVDTGEKRDGRGRRLTPAGRRVRSGAIAAAYEYSPYGETIRADVSDSAIADQPFRFSTKYLDAETGTGGEGVILGFT